MDQFIRGVTLISQICGVFAAGLIAASVVVVCEMVFIRYVLNETTIWQTDFVTFSIVAATFIGSPYLLRQVPCIGSASAGISYGSGSTVSSFAC